MARNDILPLDDMQDRICRPFRLNASETFVLGEPVSLNADGELTESADDPVDGDFLGIAAMDGDTAATNGLSAARFRLGSITDTGIVTTGDLINVWIHQPGLHYSTPNYSSGGSAFGDVAMALADILGERGGLSLISGSWGFDLTVTNFIARGMDVRDRNGVTLQLNTNGTGRKVIFTVGHYQLITAGNLDAAIA